MDIGQGKQEERPVFYGNATEIVEAVCEIRQINGPCLIKLLADSWKGSFKVSLSIMPEDFEANESHGQRTSYCDVVLFFKIKMLCPDCHSIKF